MALINIELDIPEIVVNQRPPANGLEISTSAIRATINKKFQRSDLIGISSITIPSGYNVAVVGLKTTEPSSSDYFNTGWLTSTTNSFTLPEEVWQYFAINFRRSDNKNITASDLGALNSGVSVMLTLDNAITSKELWLRRANMIGSIQNIEEVNVELPEYWRFDFTTTESNEHVRIGYYSLAPANFADLILDGVNNKSLGVNGSSAYVNIPTAGQHTMYIKINLPYSNGYYWLGVQEHDFDYIRIPYNWTVPPMFGNNNTPQINIKRMDILAPSLGLRNTSYYWLGHIEQLFVPSDKLNWYKSWSSGTNTSYSKMSDSIKAANFIYTTS